MFSHVLIYKLFLITVLLSIFTSHSQAGKQPNRLMQQAQAQKSSCITHGNILNYVVTQGASSHHDLDNDGIVDAIDQCRHSSPGAIVNRLGCEHDIDEDGVPDYVDSCLTTTIPTQPVNIYGCETPALTQTTPAPMPSSSDLFTLDVDNDNIIDIADLCLNTPAGVMVNPFGCEPDQDKDAVPDYVDACPYSQPNSHVDEYGCATLVTTAMPLAKTKANHLPDTDADGINDGFDRCPFTPKNTVIDNAGCQIIPSNFADHDASTVYAQHAHH